MSIENIYLLNDSKFKDDSDFFPLMSDEDEEKINQEETPEVISILPLRNTVLFPGVIIPITIGRARSIELIKDAEDGKKIIGVVSQKDGNIETPSDSDLNQVGTVAQILKTLRMPDGNITAIIQGRKRFELKEIIQEYKHVVSKYPRKGLGVEPLYSDAGLEDPVTVFKANENIEKEAKLN